MSNSSSCTTPITLRPLSPGILEQFKTDDDVDFDGVTSPNSKRCPTFKDYAEKIKELQKENFQLRVRIYLNERETGVKTSSSDIAVLFAQIPQFQNGSGGMPVPSTHSTAQVQSSPTSASAASVLESMNNELDKIKAENKDLREQLQERDQNLDAKINELERQNKQILEKNEDLVRDLNAANSTIQRLNESHCSKPNEEAIEKLAGFAFGQNDEIELINAELEEKLNDRNSTIARLEAELQIAQKKLISADKRIEVFKIDQKRNEARYKDLSTALQEMGKRLLAEQTRSQKLQRKLEERATENLERIAYSANSEKFESVQQLVGLLLDRMKEITDFVKTLLQLEAQKVVVLPLLTDENRASLLKSIEQCRLFSQNLEEIFYKKDQLSNSHAATMNNYFDREVNYGSRNHSRNHQHHSHHQHHPHPPSATSSTAGHSRSMFSALDRTRLVSDGVQCNLVDSSLINSLENANTYINQLKHDMSALQRINNQMGHEKAELVSQLKSLESNMNILRIANNSESSENLQFVNSKLKEENRKLTSRLIVAEEALKDLHSQHATLVGELKKLKSVNHKPALGLTSVGNTIVDSNRPSDSTSPDLGIDSGHDGAVNSDDSNTTNYKEENRILRTTNRELALKLKQTRQTLDMTLEKLNSTTKEKEQVEKAICRQLHKTHTILRQAKRSVEKFTNSQCQENIMPTST